MVDEFPSTHYVYTIIKCMYYILVHVRVANILPLML